MPAKRLLITRTLDGDNHLKKRFEEEGFQIVGKSLITFSPVLFELEDNYDWIFFYSKNAVKFFFSNLKNSISPPSKIGAIGPGTATSLKNRGVEVHFSGNGDPSETAFQFLKYCRNQKVLFPRAKNSRKSIQRLLKKEIDQVDLVVYDNKANPFKFQEKFEILIFTSPLNVKSFLKENDINDERLIAIGKVTAGYLNELGYKGVEIPESPKEEAIVKLVLNR